MKPREYEPRYVEVTDVPIEISDVYPDEEKREALFNAETELELDRNGGEPIDLSDVTNSVQAAVVNLATYYLARGATANDDVTLGDLGDDGDQTQNHAEQYLDTYEKIIDKLAQTGDGDQQGTFFGATGSGTQSYATNTGRNSRRHNLGERRSYESDQIRN